MNPKLNQFLEGVKKRLEESDPPGWVARGRWVFDECTSHEIAKVYTPGIEDGQDILNAILIASCPTDLKKLVQIVVRLHKIATDIRDLKYPYLHNSPSHHARIGLEELEDMVTEGEHDKKD